MSKVHVDVWSGSRTARITDMTNAGKRGKTCRVVSFDCYDGDGAHVIDRLCATPEQVKAREGKQAWVLESGPVHEVREGSFDELIASLRPLVKNPSNVHEYEIKGIRAPRPILTHGVEGVFSACANESGVSLSDLNDPNEWREATDHRQSEARAYELAAKVWDRVKQAKTMREASAILRDAGCRLHGWCGRD